MTTPVKIHSTYLIHNHPEGVTVRFLRRSVITGSKSLWIEQFRTHPPGCPTNSERHEGSLRSYGDRGRIGSTTVFRTDNSRKSEIRQTGTMALVDEDIRLQFFAVSLRASAHRKNRTPFKSPCTI